LSQDLVEEVCIAVGAGWIELELRAACAEGGRVVEVDGEITLTERPPLADGTTLRGGTLRGWGLVVVRGASVRVEGVAILDSQDCGVGTASTCAARARGPA